MLCETTEGPRPSHTVPVPCRRALPFQGKVPGLCKRHTGKRPFPRSAVAALRQTPGAPETVAGRAGKSENFRVAPALAQREISPDSAAVCGRALVLGAGLSEKTSEAEREKENGGEDGHLRAVLGRQRDPRKRNNSRLGIFSPCGTSLGVVAWAGAASVWRQTRAWPAGVGFLSAITVAVGGC